MVGGDDGGPTLVAGCHCRVPLQGAIVMCYGAGRRWWANFGGVEVDVAPGCHCRAPLQGAIVVCYGGGRRWREKKVWHEKNCVELLADVALSSTLITQKWVFAIWGLCWYNLPLEMVCNTLP